MQSTPVQNFINCTLNYFFILLVTVFLTPMSFTYPSYIFGGFQYLTQHLSHRISIEFCSQGWINDLKANLVLHWGFKLRCIHLFMECVLSSFFMPSHTLLLVASVMPNFVRPHRRQSTRLLCPWDSPGKNTGVGCHFFFQCMHAY